jgi:hypothetical protein
MGFLTQLVCFLSVSSNDFVITPLTKEQRTILTSSKKGGLQRTNSQIMNTNQPAQILPMWKQWIINMANDVVVNPFSSSYSHRDMYPWMDSMLLPFIQLPVMDSDDQASVKNVIWIYDRDHLCHDQTNIASMFHQLSSFSIGKETVEDANDVLKYVRKHPDQSIYVFYWTRVATMEDAESAADRYGLNDTELRHARKRYLLVHEAAMKRALIDVAMGKIQDKFRITQISVPRMVVVISHVIFDHMPWLAIHAHRCAQIFTPPSDPLGVDASTRETFTNDYPMFHGLVRQILKATVDGVSISPSIEHVLETKEGRLELVSTAMALQKMEIDMEKKRVQSVEHLQAALKVSDSDYKILQTNMEQKLLNEKADHEKKIHMLEKEHLKAVEEALKVSDSNYQTNMEQKLLNEKADHEKEINMLENKHVKAVEKLQEALRICESEKFMLKLVAHATEAELKQKNDALQQANDNLTSVVDRLMQHFHGQVIN